MSQVSLLSSQIDEITSNLLHLRKSLDSQQKQIFHQIVQNGEKSLKLLRQMKACFISSILSCNEVMTLQPDDLINESNQVDPKAPKEIVLDEYQFVGDHIQELGKKIAEMEKTLKVCQDTMMSINIDLGKALETACELKNCFNDSATSCREISLCQSVNFVNQADFMSNQQLTTKIIENFAKGLDLIRQMTSYMSTVDTITNSMHESVPSTSSAISENDRMIPRLPSSQTHAAENIEQAQHLENFLIISRLKKISNIEVPKIVMSLCRYRQEVFPRHVRKCSKALDFIRELKNTVKTSISLCERIAQKFSIHSNVGECSNQQNKNLPKENSDPVEDDVQVIFSIINTNNRENLERGKVSRPRTGIKRELEQAEKSDDTDSSDSDWSEYRRQKNMFEYTEEIKMIELVREKKAYIYASSVIFWRKMKEEGHFERHSESSLVAKWRHSIVNRLEFLISDKDERKIFETALNEAKIKREKKNKSFRNTR